MLNTRSPLRTIVILVAAAAALLIPASSASAAVNCNFDPGTGELSIGVTNGDTFVTVKRGQADDIVLTDLNSSVVACAGGTPTVSTTDTISFDESGSNQGSTLHVSLAGGPFAPGVTDETGSSDEIEFELTADGTGTDQFSMTGSGDDEEFREGTLGAGVTGANLNGTEADGVDVDITANGFERSFVDGSGGHDTLTANGSGSGSLFSGPVPFDVSLIGSGGNDVITSGNGPNNLLDGGEGDDTITGGLNGDGIRPGAGDDTADGAGGTDSAAYINYPQPVTVDLRITGPQDTQGAGTDTLSNLEDAIGGNASDTLIGTEGNNTLIGGQPNNDPSADTLIGLGGTDRLEGWRGDDTLVGGSGNDTLIGGQGSDTASYATGSTGPVSLSLDFSQTGVPQATGGAGSDTLADAPTGFTPGSPNTSDPDTNHEVENIIGTPFGGDSLTGSADANLLDTYGDGLADAVDCGDGSDSAILDEFGVDTEAGCESPDHAPQTAISQGPADGATTDDSTPTYELSANETSTFEVKIDGGGFQSCAASCTLPALADGAHAVAFRAIDADEHQNADPTPAARTVTVDTSPPPAQPDPPADPQPEPADTAAPETEITKLKVRDGIAKVRFSSSEPGSTFECQLDSKKPKVCASPYKLKAKPGKHKLRVTAIDAAGNADPTPAKAKFRVEAR